MLTINDCAAALTNANREYTEAAVANDEARADRALLAERLALRSLVTAPCQTRLDVRVKIGVLDAMMREGDYEDFWPALADAVSKGVAATRDKCAAP